MSELTPAELKKEWDAGQRPVIIDVRQPDEWEEANLSAYGAKLIPLADLPDRVGEIPKDQDVVLQCRSGGRSARAQQFLQQAGYTRVRNLTGGLLQWAAEVDPTMPRH
jgi:rhodanese-related sulfurtransferase